MSIVFKFYPFVFVSLGPIIALFIIDFNAPVTYFSISLELFLQLLMVVVFTIVHCHFVTGRSRKWSYCLGNVVAFMFALVLFGYDVAVPAAMINLFCLSLVFNSIITAICFTPYDTCEFLRNLFIPYALCLRDIFIGYATAEFFGIFPVSSVFSYFFHAAFIAGLAHAYLVVVPYEYVVVEIGIILGALYVSLLVLTGSIYVLLEEEHKFNRPYDGAVHYGANISHMLHKEFYTPSPPAIVAQSDWINMARSHIPFLDASILQCLNIDFSEIYEEVANNPLAKHFSETVKTNDVLAARFESVVVSLAQLAVATSKKAQVLAIISFIKMISPNRFVSGEIVARCHAYWSQLNSEPEAQSFEEFVNFASQRSKDWDALKNTAVLAKMYKFWMFAFTAGYFNKFNITPESLGYDKMQRSILQHNYPTNSTSMMECFVKTAIYILQTGVQIFKYQDYSGLIHSESEYVKIHEDFMWLKARHSMFSCSSTSDFTEAEYRDRLRNTLEGYKAIVHHLRLTKSPELRFIEKNFFDLQRIHLDINSREAALNDRPMPFTILLYSPPGRGKSRFTEILYQYYGKISGEQTSDRFRYIRQAAAKFWDGFRSEQWCVVIDDIAFMNPNKASNGDPTASEFLQIINTVPFVPDQAALDDKGRIPMRAKLVIGTTNTRHMHAKSYYSYPAAVHRRFPYVVEINVKDEFVTPDGQLDPAKVPVGQVPDCWEIIVSRVDLVEGGKRTDDVEILNTSSMAEFLKWYGHAIISFERKKKQVKSTQDFVQQDGICPSCMVFHSLCACAPQAQSRFSRFWKREPSRSERFWKFVEGKVQELGVSVITTIYANKYFQKYFFRLATARFVERIGLFSPRLIYKNIGRRIERRCSGTFILASLIFGLMIIKGLLRARPQIQGAVKSVPEPVGEEHQNVWRQSEIPLEQYDTSHTSKCTTREDFEKRLARNMIRVYSLVDNNLGKPCRMVCVGKTNWIAPSHCIPDDETFTMEVISSPMGTNCGRHTMTVSQVQVVRHSTLDICIVSLPHLGPQKSLLEFLPSNDFRYKGEGFHMSRLDSGQLKIFPTQVRGEKRMALENIVEYDAIHYTMRKTTTTGTCGSPLFAITPQGPVLLGVHSAGMPCETEYTTTSPTSSYALPLTRQIVEDLVSSTIVPQTALQHFVDPSIPSEKVTVGVLHPKSAIHWVSNCFVRVYGSLSTGRARPKTRVQPSRFAHFLEQRGWKTDFGAPVMRSWKPWNIALQDLGNPVMDMDLGILKKACDGFKDDILRDLPPEELKLFEPLTDKVTINGQPNVAFIDRIKRKTSAGYPWRKSKQYVTHSVDSEPGEDIIDYDEEVWEKIHQFRDTYKRGERCGVVFSAHLKDEPVSAKKRRTGKTRVFTGAPLPYTHLMRQYFLSAARVIQRNRFIFESMVGVVAQSPEWGQVYDYITVFGKDRIIAGDYKAFDKRMPGFIIMYAFDLLMDLCEISGNYDEEDLRVMRGLATDTAFPVVDFNGDLIEFIGSNPSGHPLTVIINSLVNSLYVRYCYILLNPEGEVSDFRDNVALATYGDDNIMGSKVDWFNHTSIAEILSDVDITYTMADKEAESVPFIHIDDASFLKRTWRFDDGRCICPLELTSVRKMMMLTIPSKMVSSDIQHASLLDTYLREMFFHGEEQFTNARALVGELLETFELHYCYPGGQPPVYNELCSSFDDAGRKIFPIYPRNLLAIIAKTPLA